MSLEIDADYSQQFLLPPSIEDFVGDDHPARFVRDFVAGLDLPKLGFAARAAVEGRPSYAPALLLRVWIYAYLLNVRSSRQVESLCRRDLGAMWLAGLHAPDHNSLWRFWKNGRNAVRELFKELVHRSVEGGHVGFALHALDGTKILTASSMRGSVHLKDVKAAIESLDGRIAALEEEIDAAEPREEALAQALEGARKKRETLTRVHGTLVEKGIEHEQPEELDARMMKVDRSIEWAWNAQAVVDSESGLIVASDATNRAADSTHLVEMLEQAKENTGSAAEHIVADGGYCQSEEQIATAETLGHCVTTPRSREEERPFASARFHYDEKTQRVTCPIGQGMRSNGHKAAKSRGGQRVHRFCCPIHEGCPRRNECCAGKNAREVDIGPWRAATDRARARSVSTDGQARIRKRKGIIEHVFGHIKHNTGFRRFLSRGIENIRAQWTMTCLVYNLRILSRRGVKLA